MADYIQKCPKCDLLYGTTADKCILCKSDLTECFDELETIERGAY